jgi:hypothetical protein
MPRTADEERILDAVAAMPFGFGIRSLTLKTIVAHGDPVTLEAVANYLDELVVTLHAVKSDEQSNERELGERYEEDRCLARIVKRAMGEWRL